MKNEADALNLNPKPDAPAKPRRSRLRRGVRMVIGALVMVCLLASAAIWIVTRSWFIISRLTPEMERKLGGEVTIDQAAYQGDGRVIFTGMKLRARNLSGPAADVASIGSAIVSIDLSKLLSGRVRVTHVEVNDAVFRLSEDTSGSGRMNIHALERDWTGAPKTPDIPPQVRIRKAALEFGSHKGSEYELLGRRLVSGEMLPTAGAGRWFNFEFREVDESGTHIGADGIFIKGEWNAATNEAHSRIDGLELDERIKNMCPQQVRLLWDKMDLKGKVNGVIVDWVPDQPFSVEFAVKNVALTLPIEAGEMWARYKEGTISPIAARPRMRVNSGKIRLQSDSLVLENLSGESGSADPSADLIGVPFNFSFVMSQLPSMNWGQREQWLEDVLRTAPFELRFRMDEFSLTRNEIGEVPPIDLPVMVAKVLAKFRVTDWVLSSSFITSRAAPTRDIEGNLVAGKPMTNGQAYIHKASGEYQKFPFRLNNVDAYLEFNNDKLIVHYLTGTGSENSVVRISGEIAPPDRDSSIDLRLTGTNVPLDDRLRKALKDTELVAFDSLFHRPSNESLKAAGLLPDEVALKVLDERRSDIAQQLADVRSSANLDDSQPNPQITRLEQALAGIDRSIEAGVFALGGVVNLDLKIQRELGPQQPTLTTGTIDIQSIGLLYEKFPYPLRANGGTLDWQKDRVVIVPDSHGRGLPFVAAGGGRGFVTGEIVFVKVDGKKKVLPNLTISVSGDEMNETVLAAIPLTKAERSRLAGDARWPGATRSKSANLVRGLGLSGAFDYNGTIGVNELGKVQYAFLASLENGTAQPTSQLAEAIGATNELWPHDVMLQDVHGTLDVSREEVKWIDVVGHSGNSTVIANGVIDLREESPRSDFTIDFQDLPVESSVMSLIPSRHFEKANALFERYQPQGTFDATFKYRSTETATDKVFTVIPDQISVLCDSQRTLLKRSDGRMIVSDGGVEFKTLQMHVLGEHVSYEGTLWLDGVIAIDELSRQSVLKGTWSNARFESPIIGEILSATQEKDFADHYAQYQPSGLFSADFSIQPVDGSLLYSLSVNPKSLDLTVRDRRIQTKIDSGMVEMEGSGRVAIKGIHGRHPDGEFALDGVIDLIEPAGATLRIGYDGLLQSNLGQAFLPQIAQDTMMAIEFNDGGSNIHADLDLELKHIDGGAQHKDWNFAVNGRLKTMNASLTAGTKFSEFKGIFDLDIQRAAGAPPRLQVEARGERTVVMGQTLTNLESSIMLTDDGTRVRIPFFRAEADSGVVTAIASIGVGRGGDYTTQIELVGVPIEHILSVRSWSGGAANDPSNRTDAEGELFASIGVSGVREQPETRRGRAALRVRNGRIANVPLVLQLMQVTQLTLPFTSSGLDYADADLYVMGDRLVFEQILFESTMGRVAPLQLYGEGEINLKTLELKVRFRSRGGLAVVRDIIGLVGDQLYEFEISGPLNDPKAQVVPLPVMN